MLGSLIVLYAVVLLFISANLTLGITFSLDCQEPVAGDAGPSSSSAV